ncbi:NAD-dependent epimerase/dehydratase family protein [Phytoactinopolyspora limicola]|uniref:NAD-dependent epimerase/dehydratase family protein n=1 Tax=Phytoactinopolyspora limicola TaxID=2715536 RepID=UPI00140C5ED0|nr:NAD-dependent epimerase/dehydratase family protein [Phytoactinopolyspora limicola]
MRAVAGRGNRPRVVVLGASGPVGSAVAGALASRGIALRLVARRPCPPPRGAAADVRAVDLTAPGALAGAVADVDAVVHLVAYTTDARSWRIALDDPAGYRVNVELVDELVTVLGRTRPAATVVLASTTAHTDAPASAYVQQKMHAEDLLMAATRAGVLRGMVVRLPTIYGLCPGERIRDRGVVATVARRALAGAPITMWTDGRVDRHFLHRRDVGAAFSASLRHAGALVGGCWSLGADESTPLAEVFYAIADLAATHTGKPPVPVIRVEPPTGAVAEDLVGVAVDSSAFRTVTGWSPQVPLREGLRRTVAALAAEMEEQ